MRWNFKAGGKITVSFIIYVYCIRWDKSHLGVTKLYTNINGFYHKEKGKYFPITLGSQTLCISLNTSFIFLEKWKKSKSFHKEKKLNYNDIHSPPGVKGKHSVHGVVGPADYIYDQAPLPLPEAQPPPHTQQLPPPAAAAVPVLPIPSLDVHANLQVNNPGSQISQHPVVLQKQVATPVQAVSVTPVQHKQQVSKHFYLILSYKKSLFSLLVFDFKFSCVGFLTFFFHF